LSSAAEFVALLLERDGRDFIEACISEGETHRSYVRLVSALACEVVAIRGRKSMDLAESAGNGVSVTLGVDTHKDAHVAVALDGLGRRLGALSVPATTEGYKAIVGWARGHGSVERAGVEGTGSFGAGLARYLKDEGVEVREVVRPKRRDLHRSGKSDPIDAEAAARAVLAGTATGRPKGADGEVEMIRVLRAARRSAVKARAKALNQIRALLDTAPEEMKDGLRGLSSSKLVRKASCFRPGERPCDVLSATKLALRSVARRCRTLSEEISELDSQLDRLVAQAAPELVAVKGVATDTAASLLIAAGDNPGRLDSEASFAHLCGVAPIPASSGRVVRHRLNRRGNRDANRALYVVAFTRMSNDERTRAYVARRTGEGKSKKEIIRCLKRYIAREIYKILAPPSLRENPMFSGP
jgi:transposase